MFPSLRFPDTRIPASKKERDSDEAVRMAAYSIKFSPDLPQPYFELARALWSQNPFQLHKILPEVLKGWLPNFNIIPPL